MRKASRLMLAFTALTSALAACEQSTAAPSAQHAAQGGPNLTAGVGFTNGTLARANLGEVNWESNLNGFNVQLKTHDDADVEVTSGSANASGNSGWHYHPGPVLVLVKTGALTIYHAGDPDCHGTTYTAGMTFIEGSTPHIVRNEGAVTSEFVGVFFVPAGQPRRIEADVPGNCPF